MDKSEYLNRKEIPLPLEECRIQIIQNETIYNCDWKPFNLNDYKEKEDIPSAGYLGSAKVISGPYRGIGFNVWDQNDSEFIYYKLL